MLPPRGLSGDAKPRVAITRRGLAVGLWGSAAGARPCWAPSSCRPDLVGFVNGLPLAVIELKKPGVPARAAFDENLTH